jgi:ATP-dependent Lon protease
VLHRSSLPVLPLAGTVLFPGVATPVTVARVRSLRAVEAALRAEGDEKRVFAVGQRDGADDPDADALAGVGVIASIVQVQRFGSGLSLVLLCERRAAAVHVVESDGVLVALTAELPDAPRRSGDEDAVAALSREVRDRALEYGRHRGAPEEVLRQFLGSADDPSALANHVAFYADLEAGEKQLLLETSSAEQRLRMLVGMLERLVGVAAAQERIRTAVQEELGERQRELYLREQLRAIRRELGEDPEGGSSQRLEHKLESLELPDEAREEVRRELGRLRRMDRETTPEAQVVTSWLEWVAELPWGARTVDRVDLAEAARVLEEDHHGLADVKERVLELLAVRKLEIDRGARGDAPSRDPRRAPILLFVGPPGTGKTSIAASMARALGRSYVRVSLGGVRDEADVRGHRRTYVGAMPGRVLQGMRRTRTKNPVFTLDEVDKLGASYQGDPSAALLEVLDPAQNSTFVDHYLGVPFDLSEVLFVCTANTRDGIPPPLLDRMETIEFGGYTTSEKLVIARRHLVPRNLAEHALDASDLELGDEALRTLVERYTREAGVRQLERAIGAIARKAARAIAEGRALRVAATTGAEVEALLGRPRIRPERALDRDVVGVATGLYYTPAGGDVMHVEATASTGRGELVLTGQLGDVMKESARAALTYARARPGPRHPGGDARDARRAPARAGRRRAEGRAVRGHRDGDGHRERALGATGARGHRDDGRDHPARARARRRRRARQGARRAPRGPRRRGPAARQRARPRGPAARGARVDDVPPRRHARRGPRHDAARRGASARRGAAVARAAHLDAGLTRAAPSGEPRAVARFLWICLAGALGSGVRYLIAEWSTARLGTGFPWGTLIVNLVGSFLIAAISYAALRTPGFSVTLRLTMTTGFVGGFTTYSAYNYETLRFVQEGAWSKAAAYVAATLLGCLVTGMIGFGAGRLLVGP